jgi:RNA polymerase primary sigma factor
VTTLGREPTAEEIAGLLSDVDPEEVHTLKRSARVPISLEKPVGDEDGAEFGHLLADEQAVSPDELRDGLGGEQPRTLDEVGRTFNVTRERIRQIENRSLKKLQQLPQSQQLRNSHAETTSGLVAHQLDHRA